MAWPLYGAGGARLRRRLRSLNRKSSTARRNREHRNSDQCLRPCHHDRLPGGIFRPDAANPIRGMSARP
jgi:hypothetical protein